MGMVYSKVTTGYLKLVCMEQKMSSLIAGDSGSLLCIKGTFYRLLVESMS